MTSKEFLQSVEEISAGVKTYRLGACGGGGLCDCVGLLMGAMIRLGHARYALHGSNYFARTQTESPWRVKSASELTPGEAVFKARGPKQKGYSLPARYKQGGRYATGDELDYYHIGVVTATEPLTITHCTAGGIHRDSALGKWGYAARLKDVSYGEEETPAYQQYRVISENGGPVRLRKSPSKGSTVLCKLPVGTTLSAAVAGEWAKVRYESLEGWMMSCFLTPDTSPDKEEAHA